MTLENQSEATYIFTFKNNPPRFSSKFPNSACFYPKRSLYCFKMAEENWPMVFFITNKQTKKPRILYKITSRNTWKVCGRWALTITYMVAGARWTSISERCEKPKPHPVSGSSAGGDGEDGGQRRMSRLVQLPTDKNSTVTQITMLYNCGEQKSISECTKYWTLKHVACSMKHMGYNSRKPPWDLLISAKNNNLEATLGTDSTKLDSKRSEKELKDQHVVHSDMFFCTPQLLMCFVWATMRSSCRTSLSSRIFHTPKNI